MIALLVVIFAIVILNFVRKNKLTMKYALVWLVLSLISIIVLIWPGLLATISHLLGFQTMSNMVFLVAIIVLITICLNLSVIVSNQTKKITLLIQEVSLLKNKLEDK
ncbi:DUF2304 domain-containing protein [Sharpea azabuensis]